MSPQEWSTDFISYQVFSMFEFSAYWHANGELSTPLPFPLSNFIFSSRGARKNSYLDFQRNFRRVVSWIFSSKICLLSKWHLKNTDEFIEFEDRWVLNSDNTTWYVIYTVCKLSSNETTWSQNQGGFQSQIHRESTRSLPSERRFVPQIRHVFWGHAMPCYHCKASQLKGFRQPCGWKMWTNMTPTFILPRRCVGVRWGNKNDWTSWESCMKQKSPTQSLVVSLTFGRWLSACPLCRCTRRRCPKRGSTVPKLARMNSSAKKCSMHGQKLILKYSLEAQKCDHHDLLMSVSSQYWAIFFWYLWIERLAFVDIIFSMLLTSVGSPNFVCWPFTVYKPGSRIQTIQSAAGSAYCICDAKKQPKSIGALCQSHHFHLPQLQRQEFPKRLIDGISVQASFDCKWAICFPNSSSLPPRSSHIVEQTLAFKKSYPRNIWCNLT